MHDADEITPLLFSPLPLTPRAGRVAPHRYPHALWRTAEAFCFFGHDRILRFVFSILWADFSEFTPFLCVCVCVCCCCWIHVSETKRSEDVGKFSFSLWGWSWNAAEFLFFWILWVFRRAAVTFSLEEGPINISLHLKLRRCRVYYPGWALCWELYAAILDVCMYVWVEWILNVPWDSWDIKGSVTSLSKRLFDSLYISLTLEYLMLTEVSSPASLV